MQECIIFYERNTTTWFTIGETSHPFSLVLIGTVVLVVGHTSSALSSSRNPTTNKLTSPQIKMTSPLPSFLLEDLGNLALSSPSSLIPANRHVLQARVSPTTKERLYMTEVSLPLSGLVAKTLTKHPTLSLYGAQILIDGPVKRTPAEKATHLQAYDA